MKKTLTFLMVVLGLALTPGAARADILDFTVDEDVVPLANDELHLVDGLTGKYREVIELGPGTFEATLIVNWSAYIQNNLVVDTQLAGLGGAANEYAMYALVTATGTFSNPLPGIFAFEPTTAVASVWVDPDINTVLTLPGNPGDPVVVGAGAGDDLKVLDGSIIDEANSFGLLANGLTGSFNLVFTNPTLTAFGATYWLNLPVLNLRAISNGDFDQVDDNGFDANILDGKLGGDVSFAFQVPEPVTLGMLGLGLFGVAARRRRQMMV